MHGTSSARSSNTATALIMAAARKGQQDPIAELQQKSHKCLVDICGEVMLVRVIRTLLETKQFRKIYISIEDESHLRPVTQLNAWLDQGMIGVIQSQGNLADSVLYAAKQMKDPWPLFITTGDNVLHHGEIIANFMRQFASSNGDIAIAFTEAATVRREAPDVKLAYHKMLDGEYSACNLYGLRSAAALDAVNIFRSGGQFGKKHFRILKTFGIRPFLYYKFRLAGIHEFMDRIAHNLGIHIDVIMLDYPEGPIDVDNPQFYRIAERILQGRNMV